MTTTPQTSAPPISATAPDEPIITMAGLHRRFGSGEHAVTAVNGLDRLFTVEGGTVLSRRVDVGSLAAERM